MADVCDSADAQMEVILKHQIEAAKNAKREGVLAAVGKCHNCESSVPQGAKFCDSACSEDWQYRKNIEVKRRA